MNPEAPQWRRRLPRAITAAVIGLGTVLALAGAVPRIDDTPPSQLAGEGGRPELDGSRIIPYEDHPAAAIVDSDTRKLIATRHVAGFGGAYVDEETDTLHVWLTEPAENLGQAARAALHLGAGFDTLSSREVVVHEARYTFAQLKVWKDAARDLFALSEVVLLDVSERDNRITVGVHGHDELPPAATERLTALGVPINAVNVLNVQKPPTPLLRDDHRPLTGGTQIQFQTGGGPFDTATCTLGFPALRDGVLGFVTNSHCSRTHGATDDGRYWQATRPLVSNNQVGTEIFDLPFFVGGPCPEENICSFTDANFVAAHAGVGMNRGRLASVPCCGSLNWNGTSTWRVSDNFFTFNGNLARKIGRTTGTSNGTVIGQCVEADFGESDLLIFCQDVIDMNAAPGDSGSPVFEVTHSPALNDVRAVGILWGIGEIGGDTVSVITPSPFIHDLITGPGLCAPGFGC